MLFNSRYPLLPLIFFLYLFPLFGVAFYNKWIGLTGNWGLFSIALLFISIGSLAFFWVMRHWENQLAFKYLLAGDETVEIPKSSQEATENTESAEPFNQDEIRGLQDKLVELNHQNEALTAELYEKNEKTNILTAENSDLQHAIISIKNELCQFKESYQEKLEQNYIFLQEHQQTILEQRQTIELKQQCIQQLEDKVRDLAYEIKTLLHLAEKTQMLGLSNGVIAKENLANAENATPAQKPLNDENEAVNQLRRCVEIAQKMTGAGYSSGKTAKSGDYPIEHYALNLRALFESLRSENSCAIFIYSQKEDKLIFGNNQIKTLLGWSAEKFIQSFPAIIEESALSWKNSISQLAYKNECQLELSMKTKKGNSSPVKCYLGMISTGIFRSNILGVLYG